MEDEDGEDSTPFWVQSTTNVRRADSLRRRVSAVFFSSGLVVFLLLVTAVSFLVFIVPSSISFSAQIFKPNSVKKSWDSLNIVLVLAAVIFGFLSRNQNEEERYPYYDDDDSNKQSEIQKSVDSSTPNAWYKYNYATVEGQKANITNSALTRNSSSYPDLREISTTQWNYGDYYYQRRYYDDIHVDSGRIWDPDLSQGQDRVHRRHKSLEGVEHLRGAVWNKTDIVDTLLSRSNFPAAAAAAAVPEIEGKLNMGTSESAATRSDESSTRLNRDLEPLTLDPITSQKSSPTPPAAVEAPEFTGTPELAYERMRRKKERSGRKRNQDAETEELVTTPPQDPHPPPSAPRQKSTYRKRSGASGSSTKDFLNSLYHKRKKKQRQKSVDNLDSLIHQAQAPTTFQFPPPPSPPPPPPPPHPPSAFQNLFSSTKQKRKRTITVTLAPQAPSPTLPHPPPSAASEPQPTSQTAPSTTDKPSKPIKMNNLDKLEETSNSGGESPLSRIPPPPPPPPPGFFKTPAWKFVVQGDYVRVNSNTSSRSGSPDTDDRESDVTPSAADAGDAASFHPSPLFCPSPDVDTKAESFITNFRATLKLEKIHSMKKREVGLSGLGPGRGPSEFSQGN